ncbi:MAG: hypothetical protein WBD07_08235 [Vicinamibacterales bacterium]
MSTCFRPSARHLAAFALSVLFFGAPLRAFAQVPDRLSDDQFWKLSKDSSEEDGVFRSDNLLSNETTYQWILPRLVETAKPGRVYMGVGPEQNFTYMTALRPTMAFIVDIRHGNLDVHLLYKAIFELSKDRADFVSRLFSRKRPDGLTAQSSIAEIFAAADKVESTPAIYDANLKAIEDRLTNVHHFPLSSGDHEGIAWALSNYARFGPAISYNSSLSSAVPPAIVGALSTGPRFGNQFVTYESLMLADDGRGDNRSFLASEESFQFLKNLQERNKVVPVVGDFGGTKAIRAVAAYLKSINGTVSAFYLSNVEQFLLQGGTYVNFCRSVSMLPTDEASTFIRSGRGGPYTVTSTGTGVQNSSFALMQPELSQCPAALEQK